MAAQHVASRVIFVRPAGESTDNEPNVDDVTSPTSITSGHHKVTLEYDIGDVVEQSDCICNMEAGGLQCQKVTFHHQLSATSSENADSGISLAYGKRDDEVVTSHDDMPDVVDDKYKNKSKPRMSIDVNIGVKRRADEDVRRITSRSMSRRSCSLPDILDLDRYDSCQDSSGDFRSSEAESFSSAGSLSNILSVASSDQPERKYSNATHLELSEPICGRKHLQEPCYVCFKDNEIYCNVCLSVHNFHCTEEVRFIPDITDEAKSNMRRETERELKCMRERLTKVKTENVDNFNHVKKTRKSFLKSVMSFKNSVLEILDRLEKEALLEMDIVFNTQTRRLEENIRLLESQLSAVDAYLEKISEVDDDRRASASCLAEGEGETTCGRSSIAEGEKTCGHSSIVDIQEAAKSVKSYGDDIAQTHKNTTSVDMKFEPNAELLELLSSVERLWKVDTTESMNCQSPQPCTCDRPFRFRNPVKHREFSARLSRWHFDREKCCITGSEFLPNGNLIITDNNNKKIKMFDKKYRYMSAQSLHSAPWDLAVIDAERTVVTVPDRKRLQFVTTHQKIALKNHVTLAANCWGISYDKGDLYVSCWSPEVSEVLVMDLQGTPKRRIDTVNDLPLHTPWFIRAHDDVIYISDWGTYMLSYVTVAGTSVQKYRNSELVGPLGVAFDRDSNIYVCGRDSNNIHQLSPEGELLQVLLTEKDGINQPLAVRFSPEDNRMIVTSWMSDKVQVFKFQ